MSRRSDIEARDKILFSIFSEAIATLDEDTLSTFLSRAYGAFASAFARDASRRHFEIMVELLNGFLTELKQSSKKGKVEVAGQT